MIASLTLHKPSKDSLNQIWVDPDVYAIYPFEVMLDYLFVPIYIGENTIGIGMFSESSCPPFIQSDFPNHEIEIIQISEIEFYQLLFLLFSTDYTDKVLFPLLFMGILKGASDIHLSATSHGYTCQIRQNGRLISVPIQVPENVNFSQLIKLHSNMPLSQHYCPQDGRLSVPMATGDHPVRVASVPSLYGEDFVFRLFKKNGIPNIEQLGFSDTITKQLNQLIHLKSGLVLVTGPTGAGKSTTLYSMLSSIYQTYQPNIMTLEDPIEHPIKGIRQSQINTTMGYTFSKGLRALLRQDPDVIMIGEVRDAETAKIAIEAAYTGHTVFATLHTNNCKEALLRLASFDIDPFFLTYSLRGILSQQLLPGNEQKVIGEWLSPTSSTSVIKTYQQLDDYVQQSLYIPFESH